MTVCRRKVLTQDVRNGTFGVFVLRRRVDDVWAIIHRKHGFAFKADALSAMTTAMAEGEPPAALPAGVPRRPALYDLQGRRPSDIFKLLAAASHRPAGWLLNQLYLAMPDPDPNSGGRLPDQQLPHPAVGGTVARLLARAGTTGHAV